MASFIAVGNSLLEEYYFRWFIFGRMRAFLPLPSAIAASALVFMAHHIILLSVYLPGHFWTLTVPLSLCIAVGGGIWSWLYARTGSLYAPWLSHAIIDVAIGVVGWDLDSPRRLTAPAGAFSCPAVGSPLPSLLLPEIRPIHFRGGAPCVC